jgi:hypothetical protein
MKGNYTSEPGPANTTLHFYPSNQLPVIQSHVYPHYVIYDLGKKLQHFFGKEIDQELIPELSFETWVKGLNLFYNPGDVSPAVQKLDDGRPTDLVHSRER